MTELDGLNLLHKYLGYYCWGDSKVGARKSLKYFILLGTFAFVASLFKGRVEAIGFIAVAEMVFFVFAFHNDLGGCIWTSI